MLALPRIVFVFGKGGVGRSTTAAALALDAAGRGERALVVEWAVADAIGPWFGAAPVGSRPTEVAPGVSATNFSLDEALRAYFVDHLHLRLVYKHVIRARPVARLIDVAPGLAEMFFLGQLWWLVTLAEREAGYRFDRIIVDAPATGHATSLLDMPSTLAGMGAAGLLALETSRVAGLLADPELTGAIVVTLAEPLVIDETLELVPRVTSRLGRPPLAVVINRSVAHVPEPVTWPRMSPGARRALGTLADEVRTRTALEGDLRRRLAAPILAIPELPGRAPIEVARAASHVLAEAA